MKTRKNLGFLAVSALFSFVTIGSLFNANVALANGWHPAVPVYGPGPWGPCYGPGCFGPPAPIFAAPPVWIAPPPVWVAPPMFLPPPPMWVNPAPFLPPIFVGPPVVRFQPPVYRSCFVSWSAGWSFNWNAWPVAPIFMPYVNPVPVYSTPSVWLADFVLADIIARRALAVADALLPPPPQPAAVAPIPFEWKEQIRLQVDAELQARERSAPIAFEDVIRDVRHAYAVTETLNVVDSRDYPCALRAGDLIRLKDPVSIDASSAAVVVIASKPGSCVTTSLVNVSLADLRKFHAGFGAALDNGVEQLQQQPKVQ